MLKKRFFMASLGFIGLFALIASPSSCKEKKREEEREEVIEFQIEKNKEKNEYSIFYVKKKYMQDHYLDATRMMAPAIPPAVFFRFSLFYPSFEPTTYLTYGNPKYKEQINLRIDISSNFQEYYTNENIIIHNCKDKKGSDNIIFNYKFFKIEIGYTIEQECQISKEKSLEIIEAVKKFIDNFYQGTGQIETDLSKQNLVIIHR